MIRTVANVQLQDELLERRLRRATRIATKQEADRRERDSFMKQSARDHKDYADKEYIARKSLSADAAYYCAIALLIIFFVGSLMSAWEAIR